MHQFDARSNSAKGRNVNADKGCYGLVKPLGVVSGDSEELWFFMSQCRKNSLRGEAICKK